MLSDSMQGRFTIRRLEDLTECIEKFGFVPFFENSIEGFSIEDHIDPKLWFSDIPGPWEWKGPAIKKTRCAYGKFFRGKAVYISKKWFPDFANYRRDGYDFDARFEDELASYKEKELYDLLAENAPIRSKELKRLGNYKKGGRTGFDVTITKLQSMGYVLNSDFVYETDRHGQTYGWGVAEFTTPEQFFGKTFAEKVYQRESAESYARMMKHLKKILPEADEEEIAKLLK